MSNLRLMPYDIHGVKLWAVEDGCTGFTYSYHDTKALAEEKLVSLTDDLTLQDTIRMEGLCERKT